MPSDKASKETLVYLDPELSRYGFPGGHPFSPDRYQAFALEFQRCGLENDVLIAKAPLAHERDLERFHSIDYIQFLKKKSQEGYGYFDYGDTPVFKGAFQAALRVAGAGLDAMTRMMKGDVKNAFVPIGGLHHAHENSAAGFCIINDCAIVIKTLQQVYGLKTIAYVDIDAHHGDGVYYGFENDPGVICADIHQGLIFPGTGAIYESGKGAAKGTKLNIPLSAGANDDTFNNSWLKVEQHLAQFPIEFILLQAGVDSLANDPLTGLNFSPRVHLHATRRLKQIAEEKCQGRLLVFGGGGYDLDNIAKGWVNVVQGLLNHPYPEKFS